MNQSRVAQSGQASLEYVLVLIMVVLVFGPVLVRIRGIVERGFVTTGQALRVDSTGFYSFPYWR